MPRSPRSVIPGSKSPGTGFRIAGQTQWLHTVSTEAPTFYRVSEKRGAVPANLEGGVVVHDHFKPYYGLAGVAHAYCNAHHLRELKALIAFDAEPWARDMGDLLVEANDAVRKARQQGATTLAPAASSPSSPATGRRCGQASPFIAPCRPSNNARKDGRNDDPATTCSSG